MDLNKKTFDIWTLLKALLVMACGVFVGIQITMDHTITIKEEGLRIVDVDFDSFILNETALGMVLLSPECQDKHVAIISVAGAYRTGKSFLLNFMLRYLNNSSQSANWLMNSSDIPLEGFDWETQSKTVTVGIQLWSKPFIFKDGNGTDVCVLLMDTQGLYDSETSMEGTTLIFTLSTMTSSLQVFNVKEKIQENDLQALSVFSTFGYRVQGTKYPFQNLLFLVRDWSYYWEYDYGFEGGNRYLQTRMKINSFLPEEMIEVRESISSLFETVSCYLMPHPGQKVQTQEFNGEIKSMEENFVRHLDSFIHQIFSGDLLQKKQVSGRPVTGRQLFGHFKKYFGQEEMRATFLPVLTQEKDRRKKDREFFKRETNQLRRENVQLKEAIEMVKESSRHRWYNPLSW